MAPSNRLRRASLILSLPLLALAPAAAADAKAKPKRLPVVTTAKPMQLTVGETLEVRGRNFLPGRAKNTVILQRAGGGKAVFVKADIGTRKLLRVKLPDRLEAQMTVRDGLRVATRFRLRVLSTRLGERFTKDAGSPVVHPRAAASGQPAAGAPGSSSSSPSDAPQAAPDLPPADVDTDGDGQLNSVDADDDGDLLSDALERSLNAQQRLGDDAGLEPLEADTDGDGVSDGYEYRSARDLNDDGYQRPDSYLPYPGKRPYPNPLDKADADTDFDGDWLTLAEEQRLWRFELARTGGRPTDLDDPAYLLSYSDGRQSSQPGLRSDGYERQAAFVDWASGSGYLRVQLPGEGNPRDLRDVNRNGTVDGFRPGYRTSEAAPNDVDGDGLLSDDERDEDADGLSNIDESHFRMTPEWWAARYAGEKPFRLEYAAPELDDPDTDGDGVRDGADDQDFDDVPNLHELSRNMATGRPFDPEATPAAGANPAPPHGRVNPFNPCLPSTGSRTCPRYIPFDSPWAPFDDSPDYLVRN